MASWNSRTIVCRASIVRSTRLLVYYQIIEDGLVDSLIWGIVVIFAFPFQPFDSRQRRFAFVLPHCEGSARTPGRVAETPRRWQRSCRIRSVPASDRGAVAGCNKRYR